MTQRYRAAQGGLYVPDADPLGAPFLVRTAGVDAAPSVTYVSAWDRDASIVCHISAWQTVTLDIPTACQDGIALIAARCTVQTGGTTNGAVYTVWGHVRRTGSGWGVGGLVPPDFKVANTATMSPPFQAFTRRYAAAIVGPPAWPATNETDVQIHTAMVPLTGAQIDVGFGWRDDNTGGIRKIEFFVAGAWSPR